MSTGRAFEPAVSQSGGVPAVAPKGVVSVAQPFDPVAQQFSPPTVVIPDQPPAS